MILAVVRGHARRDPQLEKLADHLKDLQLLTS